VDVWRTEIGVFQSANTDEPDGGTGLRVVAPNCDTAGRAAGDLLALAARRGRHNDFGLTDCVHDTISFIKSVERVRGSGLALAPTAMTGMNDQWCSGQTISDLPARASAFHVQLHREVWSNDTIASQATRRNASKCARVDGDDRRGYTCLDSATCEDPMRIATQNPDHKGGADLAAGADALSDAEHGDVCKQEIGGILQRDVNEVQAAGGAVETDAAREYARPASVNASDTVPQKLPQKPT